MDDEPRSLKSIFAQAEKTRLALENTNQGASASYHDDVSSAIHDYQQCLEKINQISLFSPNESAEDLSTFDLPYLLVNYHLAELIQKTPATAPQERKRVLTAARDAYERYLHLLDDYNLLNDAHAKLFSRYTEDPFSFSTVPAGADPAARRDAKIATFRAEKDLRQSLETLRSRPGYADPDAEGGVGGGDEEVVRSIHLAHLAYTTHMTFQSLESLNRELDILALAPPADRPSSGPDLALAEADERQRRGQGRAADGFDERLDGPLSGLRGPRGGPLLSEKGKPLQPFTLVGSRQDMTRAVFRPSHNLPTMSIDEYLEEERRRGGIIEGGGEASMREPEPDEDNYEKADAETMKARAWDEFTESNPKGSGNTLNKG